MLLTLAPVAFAAEPASTENEPVASTEPATPQEPTTNDDSASVEGNQGTTESAKGTKDNPFTTVEEYNAAVKENDKNGEDVYLTIQGTEGNPIIFGTKNTDADTLADNSAQYDTFALTNTQSRAKPPKLHLTLEWCEFYGNTANDQRNSSFMYLPNCQSLTIDNCKFDTGTSRLQYGINWNLCGIQNSVVSITNSTFTGNYTKNALKLNQRNGADDVATDVKLPDSADTPAASIKSVNISGCTFSGTNAIIQLGSQGKGTDGAAAPSTGAFPVTISNVKAGEGEAASDVKVELAYLAANEEAIPSVELSANETATKTEKGDLGTDADFVAKVGEDGYISLKTALDAAIESGGEVTLQQDVREDIKLSAGSTLTINGNNKTLYGTISCAVDSGENANQTNTTLTLNNLKLDGSGAGENSNKKVKNFAVNSGEQNKDVVSGLILTMNNCEVQNYIKQCLYLTNAKELKIDGCKFTGGGAFGYIVDLNLVAVQNAEISITNSTFERGPLVLSAIKVCARGKDDGTNPNDITGAQASIKSLTIEGCTFSGSGNQSDIALGVTTKNGSEPNKSGSFPVKIVDNKGSGENGALGVSLNYKGKTAEKESVSSGGAYVGDGTADPVAGYTITTTASEGGTINPSGKVAVAENGSQDFTVIANSGYSISSVTVDGGAIVERKAEGTYTVKNVTKNCTVTATFSKNSSSGGGGGSVTTKYTLSFDTNGGSAIAKVTKEKGTTVDLEQYVPTREGTPLPAGTATRLLTQKVTSVKLNGNTTVYAKWTENAVTLHPALHRCEERRLVL
ncbi:MAG: InlB B-repeat-containing protein [Evtepia gabavorous]